MMQYIEQRILTPVYLGGEPGVKRHAKRNMIIGLLDELLSLDENHILLDITFTEEIVKHSNGTSGDMDWIPAGSIILRMTAKPPEDSGLR